MDTPIVDFATAINETQDHSSQSSLESSLARSRAWACLQEANKLEKSSRALSEEDKRQVEDLRFNSFICLEHVIEDDIVVAQLICDSLCLRLRSIPDRLRAGLNRMLTIQRVVAGPDHEEYGKACSVAAEQFSRWDPATAEVLSKEALRILTPIYGKAHEIIREEQRLLGAVLRLQQKWSDAERYWLLEFEQAKTSDPDYLTYLYQELGEFYEAAGWYEKAINAYQCIVDTDEQCREGSLVAVARCRFALGDAEGAEVLVSQVLTEHYLRTDGRPHDPPLLRGTNGLSLPDLFVLLGKLYLHKRDACGALIAANQAMNLISDHSSASEACEAEANEVCAGAYELTNLAEKASPYRERAASLRLQVTRDLKWWPIQ